MVPSLPLLSCELSVSVKGTLIKKNYKPKHFQMINLSTRGTFAGSLSILDVFIAVFCNFLNKVFDSLQEPISYIHTQWANPMTT